MYYRDVDNDDLATDIAPTKPVRYPGYNCKVGSAWYDWQCAGAEWLSDHPGATAEETRRAASAFAAEGQWPKAGRDARYKAFMQMAFEPFINIR